VNPYDQAKARALLHQAGVTPPLELTMKLPPTPYARQGGEVIAAMLAKVGIVAKIENVEWAQWLSGVYGQKAYDLTIISARRAAGLRQLRAAQLLLELRVGRVQRAVGEDQRHHQAVTSATSCWPRRSAGGRSMPWLAYLYQPTWITVANARLKGVWKDMPLFANDLAALSWH
jgi:peptide/nickel transport system substrate-binding protein